MKLERIVIGVDFKDASIAAAHWVANHLAPDAELRLVHAFTVAEPPPIVRERHSPTAAIVDNAKRGAEDRLRELATAIGRRRPGRRITYAAQLGRSADVLIESGEAMAADLIVVGKHGHRGAPWNWLGSTAEAVLRASSIPVLMATGLRDVRPRHVLVALEEGELTSWVLLWTRSLSRHFEADVRGVHVLSIPPTATMVGLGGLDGAMMLDDALLAESARLAAEQWRERLAHAGLEDERLRVEAVYGDPAHTIVEMAERHETDLIIMGNHRTRRRPPVTMLGSTMRGVLRRARCPVLVVSEPMQSMVRSSRSLEHATVEAP